MKGDPINITLQYFDGCSNWKVTEAHLKALQGDGLDIIVSRQAVETPQAATEADFRGSPTVLLDGVDPFAEPGAPVGLSCRVYRTGGRFAGSPTLDQLRTAIAAARA